MAFGRHFYPKRLTKSTFVEGESNISLWYIKNMKEKKVYELIYLSSFIHASAGSNDSSQYFASVDSSQTSQKANGQPNDSEARAMEVVPSEHFNKYVAPTAIYPRELTLTLT